MLRFRSKNRTLPTIAICGPGRSGKGTTAAWFAANTPLRFERSTSEIIAPYAAERLGLPVYEAFARRHEDRVFWFNVGNELRATDPAFPVRECLKGGEIAVGMRNRSEVLAVRQERLVDIVLWIDRDVPTDPTMEFGPADCDVILQNRGTLEEFQERLAALARWTGVVED